MRRHTTCWALVVVAATALYGCAGQATSDTAGDGDGNGNGNGHATATVKIEPGEGAEEKVLEALIQAKPGEVIELGEGTFTFQMTLSLEDVEGVTVRGKGMDKTILDFSKQEAGAGGEGLKVTSGKFTIEDLTVQDSIGDGIKIDGAKGVTFRRVRAQWTGEPSENNGAYGVYPVLCEDVLIDECESYGAADAGIYVGQSTNVIVRNCRAERNVAGIEIENTIGADVYGNVTTNNAGGLLVFSLPGLKQKNGHQCRVFDNKVFENNHVNFAKPGTTVAGVPPGTGLLVMANDQVEVFNNEINNNQTANLSIISYLSTGRKDIEQDPEYDPYPEGIYIHDNQFAGGGEDPSGAVAMLVAPLLDGKLPDIVFDGLVNPEKQVDGQTPRELGLYIQNNGDADFVNFDAPGLQAGNQNIIRDISVYDGQLDPLPQVTIEGVE